MIADELARIAGPEHVIADPAAREPYERDVTGRYRGEAALVVRPAREHVPDVLRACAAAGTAVVPQGGNTGLAGGQVPIGGEVVLKLDRLNAAPRIDPAAAQVRVEAGVTLAELQRALAPTPYEFAVDHGARSGATLGGMAATNAGGPQVFRFGAMRAQVVGLEAVLADGSVIERTSGLVKDNVGYDMTGLLVGSEGTLAVITELVLRLIPRRAKRLTGLVAVRDTEAAVELLAALRDRVPSLVACELLYPDGVELVASHRQEQPPFRVDDGAYVLIECASDGAPLEELAAGLEHGPPLLAEAFADDSAGRERLWLFREAHNEALNAAGVPHKFDVTLPLDAIATFVRELRAMVERVYVYGHLGDGNLHVNVLGPPPGDTEIDARVLELVASHGGSISAEHGIGQSRRAFVHLGRTPADIEAMRAIKRALDPNGILNPGKVLPPD